MKENLTLGLCKKYLKDKRLWDLPWDEIESIHKEELYRTVLEIICIWDDDINFKDLNPLIYDQSSPYHKPREKDLPLLDELYRLPCIQDETALNIAISVASWYQRGETIDLMDRIAKQVSYITDALTRPDKNEMFWAKVFHDKSLRLSKLGSDLFSTAAPILIESLGDVRGDQSYYLERSVDEVNRMYDEKKSMLINAGEITKPGKPAVKK